MSCIEVNVMKCWCIPHCAESDACNCVCNYRFVRLFLYLLIILFFLFQFLYIYPFQRYLHFRRLVQDVVTTEKTEVIIRSNTNELAKY